MVVKAHHKPPWPPLLGCARVCLLARRPLAVLLNSRTYAELRDGIFHFLVETAVFFRAGCRRLIVIWVPEWCIWSSRGVGVELACFDVLPPIFGIVKVQTAWEKMPPAAGPLDTEPSMLGAR